MAKKSENRVMGFINKYKTGLAVFAVIFAAAGTYVIVNSRAATNTICPNLAAGDCRPYDDQSPFNQPIPSYDPATGLSTDGKNTKVWDKEKSTSYTSQLGTIGLPLTSNFNANTGGCTPGVYEINDQSSVSPNDVYDQQKTPILNSSVYTIDYRFRTYNTPFAPNDGGGVGATAPSPNPNNYVSTALGVPVTSNVEADDCDGQTVFWNPITGDEWGFWFFDPTTKSGGPNSYTFESANGHKTKTTAGFMGRFGDGLGGRGAGTTYLSGLVRKWEIKQQKIEHALSFAFNSPSSSIVYPAGKSDGGGGTTIPEGTRFQLDPTLTDTDLAGLGCTKACLTIAHALQQYGMYVIDNSGSSKIYLEAESSAHWSDSDNDGVNDTKNADVAQVASLATNLPKSLTPSNNWNKFRVVATPCVATSTSNCPTTGGTTTTTPPPSDTQDPTQPTNLKATLDTSTASTSSNTVNLTWTASSDDIGVSGYKITYGSTTLTSNGTGTTYKVTGLIPTTSYSFTVKAFDAAGKLSPASAPAIVTTAAVPDTTPPSVPVLSSSGVTTNSVNLSWTASSDNIGVASYKVYNGTTQLTSTTGTSFAVTGLSPATSYNFTVKAYDAANNVGTSNAANVTTLALSDTTKPVVSITSPANGTTVTGSVTISANATDNGSISKVVITIDGQNFATLTSPTAGSTYSTTWSTLPLPNGTHTITATATDNATTSNTQSVTSTVVVNNDKTAPSAPSPKLNATSSSSVDIGWSASTDNVGVAKYLVQRGGVTIKEVSANTLSTTDSGLTANTTYSYVIVAVDAAGNATASVPLSVTTMLQPTADSTPPTVPGGLSATASTNDATSTSQINLTWTASSDTSGLAKYTIYRNGVEVASVQPQTGSTQSWGESGLKPSTSYTYTVTATDKVNNSSAQSAAVVVNTPSVSATSSPATLSFIPSDDTNVDSGAPNTPLGDRSTINVKSNTPKKYGLLKFTVSGVGNRTVTSAKLKLYVNNGSTYGGNFHKTTTTDWKESTVTWNNKPAFGPTIASLGKVNLSTTYSIDLTGTINGDGTYGILIDSTSLDNVGYNTKNNSSNKPQLVLGVQ